MAITKLRTYDDGVSCEYWELLFVGKIDYVNKEASVIMGGWINQASHDSGASPVKWYEHVYKGQSFDDRFGKTRQTVQTLSYEIATDIVATSDFSNGVIS